MAIETDSDMVYDSDTPVKLSDPFNRGCAQQAALVGSEQPTARCQRPRGAVLQRAVLLDSECSKPPPRTSEPPPCRRSSPEDACPGKHRQRVAGPGCLRRPQGIRLISGPPAEAGGGGCGRTRGPAAARPGSFFVQGTGWLRRGGGQRRRRRASCA